VGVSVCVGVKVAVGLLTSSEIAFSSAGGDVGAGAGCDCGKARLTPKATKQRAATNAIKAMAMPTNGKPVAWRESKVGS
jgi:hypothetical protein